jgi:hypothetical protein
MTVPEIMDQNEPVALTSWLSSARQCLSAAVSSNTNVIVLATSTKAGC